MEATQWKRLFSEMVELSDAEWHDLIVSSSLARAAEQSNKTLWYLIFGRVNSGQGDLTKALVAHWKTEHPTLRQSFMRMIVSLCLDWVGWTKRGWAPDDRDVAAFRGVAMQIKDVGLPLI